MDKDNKLEYVFSRKLCKENLNKMYSSCIIFFIVFLIMGSMGFYAKGEVKAEILAIAVPIAMICFCIVGFLVSRQVILPEYKKYQEPCFLGFWGIMMAGTLFWIMQYADYMQITVLYGIFLLMFSTVPILPSVWQKSYFVIQAVWIFYILIKNQNVGIEYLLCIASWNLFSIFLVHS